MAKNLPEKARKPEVATPMKGPLARRLRGLESETPPRSKGGQHVGPTTAPIDETTTTK